jgi:hypothetical protein
MSNPNKARGTRFEVAIVEFLQAAGLLAYAPRQFGPDDIGDVHVPPFIIQAKDYSDMIAAFRDGVEGSRIQKIHAKMPFGVAVVKRRRKPIADAYVVLRLGDFPDLVRAVQAGVAAYEQDTED